ncbi:MAG TPA: redoxin domain-containing protein [Cytophagaceae bacterium]
MTLLYRYIHKLALLLLLCLFINNTIGSVVGLSEQKEVKIPQFTYYTIEGKTFGNKDLKKNTKLIFMYFNPLCDICVSETQNILGNYYYLQEHNIQLVMVSPNKLGEIVVFKDKFGLDRYENITVLHDRDDTFYKQFNAIGYPTLYLYNEEQNLITSFETEVDFEEIKVAFNKTVVKK